MGKKVKERVIPEAEYLARLEQGVPVGDCWVDMGNGELAYALQEVVVVGKPYNKYRDKFFIPYNISIVCVADKDCVDTQNKDAWIMYADSHNVISEKTTLKGIWVQRRNDIFYDRDISSQEEAEKKYGKNVKCLKEGTKIEGTSGNSYTLKNENKGVVYDKDGHIMDNSKQIQAKQYIIYGTCDTCLDLGTLHRNYFGTSYIGPDNPLTYNKKITYDYMPKYMSEIPAFLHDQEYDALKISGVHGALFETKALGADIRLVYREVITAGITPDYTDKARSIAVAYGFYCVINFKLYILAGEKAKYYYSKSKNKLMNFYMEMNNTLKQITNPLNYY